MNRRFCIWVLSSFVAFSSVFGAPFGASAAPNDEDVEALVESVIAGDYASKNYKDALDKLALAKQACEAKKACSPKVRAKVYIALGTVYAGGQNKQSEAKEAFATALKEDPSASLFSEATSPNIQKAFDAARSTSQPPSTGPSEPQPGQPRKPKKEYTGDLKPARGWKSGEAFFYFREALASEQSRDWADCVDYVKASLEAENRPTTRMLGAACEEKAGQWTEAYADYKIVAETAGTRKYGLYDVANKAKTRMKELRDKIPKIILSKPAKVTDLQVKMDDAPVDENKIGGEIWVNPGQYVIQATGKVEGVELEFEQIVDVTEFESVRVDIQLGPKASKDRTLMKCLLSAKTRDDFEKCVGESSGGGLRGLNLRMGLEVSGYHDSDATDVVTPALSLVLENPTSGWGVSGSFLVDVVTTASADIISTASPRWTETRYVPALSGHKKFGDVDVNLHTSASIEPDYLAIGVGAGVSAELRQKTITPSLNYDFGYDIAGRSGTSFEVFSRKIHRHGIDAGLGFIIDKATFAVLSLTTVFDFGDQSKPYRYIPLFAPDVVPFVPAGLTVEGVAQSRLPERVLEQVPLTRQRFALAGRIGHRFASSTIRADQRFYIDSWGVKASTTDAKFLVDVIDGLRVWPHIRFNAQSGADFWQRAYSAQRNPMLNLTAIPALRAGDRELGPMFALTAGGGVRYEFGAKKELAFQFTADMIYTRFLDHLYILQRFGYFGASTFEVEFE